MKLFGEEELVPLSALQHYSYCPRQCALIHLEQVFEENVYTLRGQAVHGRVNLPQTRWEEGSRVERSLPLYSYEIGLVGKADVVEFSTEGIPFPVEYKHGHRRKRQHDDIQLAGQALCLEEMTGKAVIYGAVYHFSSRHRRKVEITEELRKQVKEITVATQNMLRQNDLPLPVNDSRCRHCSLYGLCQPKIIKDVERLRKLRKELFAPE